MTDMFDNYPQPVDYTPNNRDIELPKDYEITRGADAQLIFILPWDLTGSITKNIIYTQEYFNALEQPIYITKAISSGDIDADDGHKITCNLDSTETILFQESTAYTTIKAQVIATLSNNEEVVSQIFKIKVLENIENNENGGIN